MTKNTNKNGETGRDMMPAAPQSEITPSKFWILITLLHLLYIVVKSLIKTAKDTVLYLLKQKKSVKGKVVVITGTGRGLGRNIALRLSRLGAHIACLDINTKNNEETVQLIRQEGGKAEAFTVNVAKIDQVEKFTEDVMKKFGQVDILVNNAALVMAVPIREMSYEDIKGFYEINAMSPVFMIKSFYQQMRKRNSGHIVSISSVASFSCLPWLSLYCATKASVTRFMETLEVEMNFDHPDNKIKTTTIHPYFINTSADYFRFFKLMTPILTEDFVVDESISAILYEKNSVYVPEIFRIVRYISGMVALHTYRYCATYIGRNVKAPTIKDRAELPYGKIISSTVADSK